MKSKIAKSNGVSYKITNFLDRKIWYNTIIAVHLDLLSKFKRKLLGNHIFTLTWSMEYVFDNMS